MIHPLISAKEVYDIFTKDNVVLLDASRKIDSKNSILGAKHFDIKNTFSDTSTGLPNSFPDAKQFQNECRELGINNSSKIVVFDNEGIFTSPRVWFMFRAFGHEDIMILDGGLPEWINNNYPTAPIKEEDKKGDFIVLSKHTNVITYEQICDTIETKDKIIMDARSSSRFSGSSPEPRSHIKSGSIPNSLNLPYTNVLEKGKFKSKTDLKKIIDAYDLQGKQIIFSCGSGITACIILIAFMIVNPDQYFLYDGSWTEWAERKKLFVV